MLRRRSTAKSTACPRSCISARASETAKPATISRSSSTEPTHAAPISIWPMPLSARARSATRTPSGVLRLPAFGGRSLCKANMRRLDVDLPGGTAHPQQPAGTWTSWPALNPFTGVPESGTLPAGMSKAAGSSADTRPMRKRAGGAGRRSTIPMFHGSGGWGALQIVGKYDVLDMSDSRNIVLAGFQGGDNLNFVGACAVTPLFPGNQRVTPPTAANRPMLPSAAT